METWFSPVGLQRTPGLAVDGQYVLENQNVSIVSECFVLKPCLLLIYCTFLSCVFMGVCVSVLVIFPFSFFSLLALFYFALFLLACLGVALEGGLWGSLGGEEEGETVIRIYCVKNTYF